MKFVLNKIEQFFQYFFGIQNDDKEIISFSFSQNQTIYITYKSKINGKIFKKNVHISKSKYHMNESELEKLKQELGKFHSKNMLIE
ncbi:hypothetical protein [Spirobacillus cienkowskii]|jgi:hypothetical protein|uniref:Uncharacterized protein n=1 Tax=Spirobacillus cienkowskii TaxID=495820 RepID=A0A369KVK3_9BACT|nr:MAG: hypothetical protein DCC88_03055 [Spirobacillus cienkowskii]